MWLLTTALVLGTTKYSECQEGAQFLHNVINQLKIDNVATQLGQLDRIAQISGPTPLPNLSDFPIQGQYLNPFEEHVTHHNNGHDGHIGHESQYGQDTNSGHEVHHAHQDEHHQPLGGQENGQEPQSDQHYVAHLASTSISHPPPPLSADELKVLYEEALKKGATLDLGAGGPLPGGLTKEQLHQLGLEGDQAAGYYYYFYPLKDFGKEEEKHSDKEVTDDAMMMMSEGGEKRIEPLFVAMSGFIGMALVFVVSVLFLPKFGALRSRGTPAIKQPPNDLSSLTRLVLQAINGKDCSARIACEVGRAMRKMHLDNKPLRVLEIILPPGMGKQIQLIRQSAGKKHKCQMRCTGKLNGSPSSTPKPQPKIKKLVKHILPVNKPN